MLWADDGGRNWTLATASAAWGGRAGHVLMGCGDGLLVAGGRAWDGIGLEEAAADSAYGGLPDEAWGSRDGGVWELRGTGPGGRDKAGGACDGGRRTWIVGGVGPTGGRSDVWVSDSD